MDLDILDDEFNSSTPTEETTPAPALPSSSSSLQSSSKVPLSSNTTTTSSSSSSSRYPATNRLGVPAITKQPHSAAGKGVPPSAAATGTATTGDSSINASKLSAAGGDKHSVSTASSTASNTGKVALVTSEEAKQLMSSFQIQKDLHNQMMSSAQGALQFHIQSVKELAEIQEEVVRQIANGTRNMTTAFNDTIKEFVQCCYGFAQIVQNAVVTIANASGTSSNGIVAAPLAITAGTTTTKRKAPASTKGKPKAARAKPKATKAAAPRKKAASKKAAPAKKKGGAAKKSKKAAAEPEPEAENSSDASEEDSDNATSSDEESGGEEESGEEESEQESEPEPESKKKANKNAKRSKKPAAATPRARKNKAITSAKDLFNFPNENAPPAATAANDADTDLF